MSLSRCGEDCIVSTYNDYKRSGHELLLGLERRRASTMVGDQHEEDEEDDPRTRLDHLE